MYLILTFIDWLHPTLYDLWDPSDTCLCLSLVVSSSGCSGYFSWLLSATSFSYFSADKYHSHVQFHPRYGPCYYLSEDLPTDLYQVLEQPRVPASSVKYRVFKVLTVLGLSTRTPLVLLDICACGKCTCWQAWWPEFNPQDPRGRTGLPASCPLIPTHVLWHTTH